MRAAIIGCGKIGSECSDDPRVRGIYSHAGAYDASARAELVAVCDMDRARADRCARRWGVPGYTNIDRLLQDEQPDIISVCTPDATHATVLRAVLSTAGVRGVLAEKPLAIDVNEAEELTELAAANGVRLAVNYSRRYAAGHQRLGAALADGLLGEIESVTGAYSGGLVHNGSHWLDLGRWLVGEVVTVHAWPRRAADFDVRFEFAGGAGGFLQSYPSDAFSLFEMDLMGSRGRARIVDAGQRIERYTVGDSPQYTGYRALLRSGEDDGGIDGALMNAVDDLIDSIESGRAPRCSGADGVAALRLAEAAATSARLGRTVELEPRS